LGVEQRYAAVTRALISGIADGRWPVGSNLPGETELAEAFSVSRGTVRVALEKLQGLGLISRRKRAGTKVEARHPVVAVYEPTISSVDELIQYSANSTRVIHGIRNIVADKALAQRLGCSPGSAWMEVQASRSAPGVVGFPMAWWTVYVTEQDGELIRAGLETDQRLISDLIHEASGRVLNEVRQTVRAIGVPAALAPELGVEPDAHALEFIRQYFDQARELFQVAVSIHPGDRSAYSTVLKRQTHKEP
jgi:GntR family transcriptional regulator